MPEIVSVIVLVSVWLGPLRELSPLSPFCFVPIAYFWTSR